MLSGSRWAKAAMRVPSRAAAITKTSTSRRAMVGELRCARSYRQDLGRATSTTSIARGRARRLNFRLARSSRSDPDGHINDLAAQVGNVLADVFGTELVWRTVEIFAPTTRRCCQSMA